MSDYVFKFLLKTIGYNLNCLGKEDIIFHILNISALLQIPSLAC